MDRLRVCLIGMLLVLFLSFLPTAPAYAATYTVVNTDDSGVGSLRWAINQANLAGADTIAFNIPGGGVHTIQPLTPLPRPDRQRHHHRRLYSTRVASGRWVAAGQYPHRDRRQPGRQHGVRAGDCLGQ